MMKLLNFIILVLIIMSTLIGCKSNDDLHAYIQEVNMRKGGRIAPLPEIKPERAMERKEIRDLFEPLNGEERNRNTN